MSSILDTRHYVEYQVMKYIADGSQSQKLNISSVSGACLAGHQLHNGSCYRFYNERKFFFAEAESHCNKLKNGHVAAYHSQEDFRFLDNLIG